jgi:thiol-disulfide isomerase/thioredoxin
MKKNILIIIGLVIAVILIGSLIFLRDHLEKITKEFNTGNSTNATKKSTNFTLADLSGTNIALSDFKGKKVFLNFWATWCGPCIQEMPYINEIYKEDKNIEIVTVNLSEPKNIVEKFIQNNNYEFRVLLDIEGEVGDKYQAYSIPTSVLINEEGDIIDTHIGSMTKEQLINFMQVD